MYLNLDSEKPIYVQMAEWIEENILSGTFPEESQIPSTTDVSAQFKINPATALKGVNILVDKGIIYKKRGLGMFVCKGAEKKLRDERKQDFFENFVKTLLSEAEKLNITKKEIVDMIEKGCDDK